MNVRNILFLMLSLFFIAGLAHAADPKAAVQVSHGMTLWETLVAGGSVMVVIILVSIAAVAIIIYDFITFKPQKLIPSEFFKKIMEKLEDKDVKGVRDLCTKESNNALSRIILAGLDKVKKNLKDGSVKEAMEHRARIEIGNLWQNLNYLSDIITVAPLLGLLGTVFGMIQAFNAVPLQSSGVKVPVLVAGISKAMVNTGAGLIIAIAVLMAYSYFRGRVVQLTNLIETYTTDVIKTMENL